MLDETIVTFGVSTIEFMTLKRSVQKTKNPQTLRPGPKLSVLGCYWSGFWKKKKKIKTSTVKVKKIQSFFKTKNHKFGIKIDVFGYFWAGVLKNNFYIKPSPSDLWNCKVLLKTKKNFNSKTKNSLFVYF